MKPSSGDRIRRIAMRSPVNIIATREHWKEHSDVGS